MMLPLSMLLLLQNFDNDAAVAVISVTTVAVSNVNFVVAVYIAAIAVLNQ